MEMEFGLRLSGVLIFHQIAFSNLFVSHIVQNSITHMLVCRNRSNTKKKIPSLHETKNIFLLLKKDASRTEEQNGAANTIDFFSSESSVKILSLLVFDVITLF